jgi:hypothetical protein
MLSHEANQAQATTIISPYTVIIHLDFTFPKNLNETNKLILAFTL